MGMPRRGRTSVARVGSHQAKIPVLQVWRQSIHRQGLDEKNLPLCDVFAPATAKYFLLL
eukprot:TRINITY_DN1914_c0_g1_i1.p2 TRINITY_DN1914_c0_g1~~TRINITY_DN1914_c0_g1_i1.p2  ORF type:complete len:59 (-),score=4.21 TRINITY_DN1914_c0_g1_i1:14-190(-)